MEWIDRFLGSDIIGFEQFPGISSCMQDCSRPAGFQGAIPLGTAPKLQLLQPYIYRGRLSLERFELAQWLNLQIQPLSQGDHPTKLRSTRL